MPYVVTDACVKDNHCVEACPVDCIHPKQDEADFEQYNQMFVSPDECIDCGACVPVCPEGAIFPVDELPEDKKQFAELNAQHFAG